MPQLALEQLTQKLMPRPVQLWPVMQLSLLFSVANDRPKANKANAKSSKRAGSQRNIHWKFEKEANQGVQDIKPKKTLRLPNTTVGNMVQTLGPSGHRHTTNDPRPVVSHGYELLKRDFVHLMDIIHQVPSQTFVSGPVPTLGKGADIKYLAFLLMHYGLQYPTAGIWRGS